MPDNIPDSMLGNIPDSIPDNTPDRPIDVSVVMPVYNCEKYLRQTLDCLAAQTLPNVEFLLVDDGSRDSSGQIIDEYAAADPRFKAYHQENGGASRARNYGLDRARGRYIIPCDSDDLLDRRYLEIPFAIAEKYGADMVMFQRDEFVGDDFKGTLEVPGEIDEMPVEVHDRDGALHAMLALYGFMPWNKLVRREIFDGMRYKPGFAGHEDVLMTYKEVLKAEKTCTVDLTLYHYRLLPKSASHAPDPQIVLNNWYAHMVQDDDIRPLCHDHSLHCLDVATLNAAVDYAIKVSPFRDRALYKRATQMMRQLSPSREFLLEENKHYLDIYLRSPLFFHLACIRDGKRLR